MNRFRGISNLIQPLKISRMLALAFFTVATGMSLSGSADGAVQEERRPNIIFFLADDLGQGDVGCYGQQKISTPRLDRMAAEGTRFLQAYSGSGSCTPSRSSLLTGLHSGHGPIRANRELKPSGQMPWPADTYNVARMLNDAGYATACTGKWGLGPVDSTGNPLRQGFDHFFGYNCQRHAQSYFPTFLYNDNEIVRLPLNDDKNVGHIYAPDVIAQDTLQWIRAQADQADRPFFLFYAMTLPHGWRQIHDQGEYALREGWTDEQKTYAAMVTRMDHELGRMLDLLVELGIDDNTLVIFAGDNGTTSKDGSQFSEFFDQTMGGKLRGRKRQLYENALRQAAVARWPGRIPAGRVSDEPWAFWDFLPTCAELADIKVPDSVQVDGLSLVSYLEGGPAPQREAFYWEIHEQASIQAVRFGDWKALRQRPSAPIRLYDLGSDSGERNDLSAEQPELVARAASYFETLRTPHPFWPLREKGQLGKGPGVPHVEDRW